MNEMDGPFDKVRFTAILQGLNEKYGKDIENQKAFQQIVDSLFIESKVVIKVQIVSDLHLHSASGKRQELIRSFLNLINSNLICNYFKEVQSVLGENVSNPFGDL